MLHIFLEKFKIILAWSQELNKMLGYSVDVFTNCKEDVE